MSTRERTLREIGRTKLVPAVRTRTATDAVRAMRALYAGGVRVFEVPLTVPGALGALEVARTEFGDGAVLGAGTVLDAESARAAILAGAAFLVSPSLTLGMVEVARRYGVPALCGALTPTEIVAAWEAGADYVKVFPASAMGGPAYVRSLRGPLPQVALMPMGGVTVEMAGEYLRAGARALGVGSDLVRQSVLDAGRDEEITEAARVFVAEIAKAGEGSLGA